MDLSSFIIRKYAQSVFNTSGLQNITPAALDNKTESAQENMAPINNDDNITTTGTFENCLITDKRETFLIIKDENEDEHRINTNIVENGYTPEVGDKVWIDVHQTTINNRIYKKVYADPNDKKEISGKVKKFDGTWGVIDDYYLFNARIFEEGFRLNEGSAVNCTVIGAIKEYEGETYFYRCLNIKFDNKSNFNASKKNRKKNKHRTKTEGVVKLTNNRLEFNFEKEGDKKIDDFILENQGDTPQTLKKVYFKISEEDKEYFDLTFEPEELHTSIEPNETFEISIRITAKKNGSRKIKSIFYFEDFILNGTIVFNNYDPEKENNKTKFESLCKMQDKSDKIPGQKPVSGPKFMQNHLPSHFVPFDLQKIVLQDNTSYDKIRKDLLAIEPELDEPLSYENYRDKFHTLLFLEEIDLYHQMRQYDQEVRFGKEDGFFTIQIDGLDERRPSVVIGDIVRILGTKYEGYIHHVKSDKILLKFNREFHEHYNAETVKLFFEFSRINFRKQHEAIDRIYQKVTKDFLLPEKVVVSQPIHDVVLNEAGEMVFNGFSKKIHWHNANLNEIQKKAIVNALRGECRPLPYIIYGPPGTGKTMTLIEIIQQIIALDDNAHVLVATPSNSSANLITERLNKSDSNIHKILVRAVGQNVVEKENIPEALRQFCATLELAKPNTIVEEENRTSDGVLLRMPLEKICRKRIIIGTCAIIGNLMTHKFRDDHFTHVIIDEAGQLIEPEAMIPISLLKHKGQVILAGDPKQLGPIIFSRYANEFNLNQSYLDRLLRDFPYSEEDQNSKTIFNDKLVTKLLDNYRAIPSILRVYNEIFYNGTLNNQVTDNSPEMQALQKAQPMLKERSNDYSVKKSGKCGMHFVAVAGEHARDPNSPSWYNQNEVNRVVNLYVSLLDRCNFRPENIGIISPYKAQCKKILEYLYEKRLKCLPKVGSVEEFQGQEREVIIISTVRTMHKSSDSPKMSLGFVKEPRRMNVSISRAKSLLFVVGCPEILETDDNWLQLINYALRDGTYHGERKAQNKLN